MRSQQEEEILATIKEMAPGVEIAFTERPAYGATQVRVHLELDYSKMVSDQAAASSFASLLGLEAMEMLAEIQKQAVKAIGLEAYVRERELAVLDRAQSRIRAMVSGLTNNEQVADTLSSQLTEDLRADLGA